MTIASSSIGPRLRAVLVVLLVGMVSTVSAHEGHDDAPAAAAGTASPRLSAHSDLFELVGIVDHGRMTVYLDRYATNAPVTGATITFESGEAKGTATPQPDGTYLIAFEALAGSGELPFSFMVTAGADSDLLAADLVLADDHDHADTAARPWARPAAFAAGALALVLVAFTFLRSVRRNRRTQRNA